MTLRVSVVGATGYVGSELVRLLSSHPGVALRSIVGHGKAGQPIAAVLPSHARSGVVEAFDAGALAAESDAVFCALPHGASAAIVAELRARGVVVLDLSADFRLSDLETYRAWYGEHHAPELAPSAVYGLVELHRDAIRGADLIAVPGCYPTASILALAPLLARQLVSAEGIVVDAKSGVSGAGRNATAQYAETAEGMRAYKIAGTHRHTPEIEQELSRVAGREVRLLFTPHLAPMTRGILATCYAACTADVTAEVCTAAARELYRGSSSVTVLDPGACPDTLWTRGSNRALVSYAVDARTSRVVAQGAIDNLVKGAAGQAVQCLNVRFGLDESAGLAQSAVWP